MKLPQTSIVTVLLIVLLSIIGNLSAAWLSDLEFEVTQPDGTVLSLFVTGDEFYRRVHNSEGFSIIQDRDTDFWCWAIVENDELVSTGYPVHLTTPQSLNLQPNQSISGSKYLEYRELFDSSYNRYSTDPAPTIGTVENIVIFVRFSDQTEFPQGFSVFENEFNDTTPGASSVKNYFLHTSYQQLTMNATFYPEPSGNTILSYQDTNPRNYFTISSAGSQAALAVRLHAMMRNAILQIAPQVPTTLNIDADNNGFVDNVIFIIRGAAETGPADLLWPHKWFFYYEPAPTYINGKRVYQYNLNIENFSNRVSVYCHELGHALGLPDYYNYNNVSPIGNWCIMAHNNAVMQSMSAYAKEKLGWITIPTLTHNGTFALNALTSESAGAAYRINSSNANNQYYVVEYRRTTGTGTYIDSTLPGSGMLVYRVRIGIDTGNINGPPDELYIYRPGGTISANGTIASANFSSQAGRTSITPTTNPAPFLYGNPGGTLSVPGDLNITNIGNAGTTISFQLNSASTNEPVITSFPWTESFNTTTFPPTGWFRSGNGTGNWARTTASDQINTGSGAAISRSRIGDVPLSPNNWLITPKLAIPNNAAYELTFFVRSRAGQTWGAEQYSVYVSTTGKSIADFVTVLHNETLQPEGQTYLQRSVNLADYSGQSIYIAFRHHDSYNQEFLAIDDVRIDVLGLPQPKNLTHEVEGYTVILTWQPPDNVEDDFIGYNVYRASGLLNGQPITELSFTDLNVPVGTHTYSVTAMYSEGQSAATSTTVTVFPIVLNPPLNLVATLGDQDVLLTWNIPIAQPLATLTGFKVYRNGIALTPDFISDLLYTDDTISYNVNYIYYVTAIYVDPDGESLPSNEQSVIIQVFLPPENLDANVIENNVTLIWDAPYLMTNNRSQNLISIRNNGGEQREVQGYWVQRNSVLIIPSPITATTYQDNELEPGTYTYDVTAVYATGNSEPASITITIYTSTFNAPQSLIAEPGDSVVNLFWQAAIPQSTATLVGYKVYRNELAISDIISVLEYQDVNVVNNNTYTYYVTAIYENPTGESDPSNSVSAIPEFTIIPPTNLTANVFEEDNVILNWDAALSLGVIGYNIYRDDLLLTETPIIETEYTDAERPLDTMYSYAVTAVFSAGESTPIEENIIVPRFNPPSALLASVEIDKVKLTWHDPLFQNYGNVIEYRIERSIAEVNDFSVLGTTNLTTFTDNEVSLLVEYAYHVIAIWGEEIEGESLPSNVVIAVCVDEESETNPIFVTKLIGNFPNPFNPQTTIEFNLDKYDAVTIDIFNIRGQKIKNLVDDYFDKGNHSVVWYGNDNFGNQVGSGIYFYVMKTNGYAATKRMILLM